MNVLTSIKSALSAYFPETPENIAVLGSGLCVVPGPKRKAQKAPPKEEQEDVYVINEDTKTFGFYSNKSVEKHDGSVAHLTDYDVSVLYEHQLWGGDSKRGIESRRATANAKKLWHDGAHVAEIMASLNMSKSWVDHRVAAFGAALSLEMAENKK